MQKDFCEFCEIIEKKQNLLIYKDEKVVAFHDIDKGSSREHILVCPLSHIEDVSTLNETHIPLLDYMQSIGRSMLEKLAPDAEYRLIPVKLLFGLCVYIFFFYNKKITLALSYHSDYLLSYDK